MSGQMVEFSSNGQKRSGYLAVPKSGSGSGVVIIQEWWGLVPHIKDICDRFAAEGYVAMAPDLYHGKTTRSPDEAGKLLMAMRIDDTEKDLRGAIQYLLQHKAVWGKKVGTVGFCMGGALSLYAATRNPQVGACVVFYGGHPNVKPDLPNLQAPVLGLYGDKDGFVTPQVVRDLEESLQQLGKTAEMHIYPEAGHAFFNNERPDAYNAEAARDAWQRVLKFFARHLG